MGSPGSRKEIDSAARPFIFDTGALIAIERGDKRARALTRRLAVSKIVISIPTPVIAEAWRGGGGRQARLARFLASGIEDRSVRIVDLDYDLARDVGAVLARISISIADAAVCLVALRTVAEILTSDPTDIRKMIPGDRITIV